MKLRKLIERTGQGSVALGQIFNRRDYIIRNWKSGRSRIPDRIFIDILALVAYRNKTMRKYNR